VYGSEKGDLSYTDAAYQGILSAKKERPFTVKEFTPRDYATIPALLNSTSGTEKPGLVITVGFQYTSFTQDLAAQYPDIQFLGIDQSGTGSPNLKAYEITSYGDSYLAGVLAASATKTGKVGIIMGMKTSLLDTFIRGYTDGARATNASVIVDHAYVHETSVNGFADPVQEGRIAQGMYRNGTDVIFTGAGYSNMGAFGTARNVTGLYILGTDSDQSPLGPEVVLASAVKRVDRVVQTSVLSYLSGSFTGGNQVAGLREGATGIVFNSRFASYNATVSAREARAIAEEEKFLAARG
jgi:basic membrane protein A